jgi:hypothetical protein
MTKRKRGLTAATEADVCRQVAQGRSLRATLKAPGMPAMSTVMKWLQEHPRFAEQYARARVRGIEVHIDGLIDLADTANAHTVQAIRLKVDVRKWIASKLVPKIYGDELAMRNNMGEVLDPHEVARGIRELAGALFATEPIK